jgi:hypothetical protein
MYFAAAALWSMARAMTVLCATLTYVFDEPRRAKALGAYGHCHAIGAPREVLTCGAVTDRDARRIDRGFELDGSAMARAVNLHEVTYRSDPLAQRAANCMLPCRARLTPRSN